MDETARGSDEGRAWAAGLGGLRLLSYLAAAALLIALILWQRSTSPAAPEADASLTAADVDAYVAVALEVRLARRAAREAGWKPARWSDWPDLQAALAPTGWSMEDYLRVEGQVAAARLRITDPGIFGDDGLDPNARPVPEEHVDLVRQRLDAVRRAQAPLPEPVDVSSSPATARTRQPPP